MASLIRGGAMDQLSFASLDFATKKKRTKRDVFLAEMAAVVPWGAARSGDRAALSQGRSARRAAAVPTADDAAHLLPAAVVQPVRSRGAEEALYDIQSMRAFAGLELGRDAIPDETTILNFRHLLERHDLTKAIFAAVAEHLEARGAMLRGGTIVDATLIAGLAVDERTSNRSAIPRCDPPRRGTSGISA